MKKKEFFGGGVVGCKEIKVDKVVGYGILK